MDDEWIGRMSEPESRTVLWQRLQDEDQRREGHAEACIGLMVRAVL